MITNIKEDITKIVNSCSVYNRDTGEFGYDNNHAIDLLTEYVKSLLKIKDGYNDILTNK